MGSPIFSQKVAKKTPLSGRRAAVGPSGPIGLRAAVRPADGRDLRGGQARRVEAQRAPGVAVLGRGGGEEGWGGGATLEM